MSEERRSLSGSHRSHACLSSGQDASVDWAKKQKKWLSSESKLEGQVSQTLG